MKDLPCCARKKSNLMHERGELRRLAAAAARRKSKGLIVTDEALAAIANTKDAIHEAEQAIIDHDAMHAEQDEVA